MNGRYYGLNDFWRERMDFYHDDLQRYTMRGLKAIGVVFVATLLLIAALLLSGCRSHKTIGKESSATSDSVRIEYREKIVYKPHNVYIEVPVESKERISPDSTSHLETSFAISDASMVWIDGVAFLRHSLENKPQKIEKQDSVPVTEKEKIVWKTRRVTYNKTEIREKQLAWWQKGLMWAGAILSAVLFVYLIILLAKKGFLQRKSML